MSTKTTTGRRGRIKTGNGCDEPPDPRTILLFALPLFAMVCLSFSSICFECVCVWGRGSVLLLVLRLIRVSPSFAPSLSPLPPFVMPPNRHPNLL